MADSAVAPSRKDAGDFTVPCMSGRKILAAVEDAQLVTLDGVCTEQMSVKGGKTATSVAEVEVCVVEDCAKLLDGVTASRG